MTDEDTGASHVVVVGGGIAGLAAAHRLSQSQSSMAVTLIEAEPRFGGKIVTERIDGFLIEGGPDSFLSAKARGTGLCQEVGLGERLIGTTPRRRRAFVLRRRRLHDLPEGLTGLVPTKLGPMLRTGLVSPIGKARLALDYALPPRAGTADESLAAFVRRRLGREVFDGLVEPLMAGIYAGDGDRLSLAATFPHLRHGEREHGGLIRGVLAAKRGAAATAGSAPPRPPFLTPVAGLGELVDALVDRLRTAGVRLLVGDPVRRVERSAGGYAVELATGRAIGADAVIAAVPSHAAAGLVQGMDGALAAELDAIPHASSAIVSLGYRREDVPHSLDGHGYVIPRVEGRAALACTWTSEKWTGRALAGRVLLRVFVGRFGREEALSGSDADLVELARAEVRDTLGIDTAPLLTRVQRWPRGMPQYVLGHLDRLVRIDGLLTDHPGLFVAGNAYRGVGLPDCIASGEAAADAAHAHLCHRDGIANSAEQPPMSVLARA